MQAGGDRSGVFRRDAPTGRERTGGEEPDEDLELDMDCISGEDLIDEDVEEEGEKMQNSAGEPGDEVVGLLGNVGRMVSCLHLAKPSL